MIVLAATAMVDTMDKILEEAKQAVVLTLMEILRRTMLTWIITAMILTRSTVRSQEEMLNRSWTRHWKTDCDILYRSTDVLSNTVESEN